MRLSGDRARWYMRTEIVNLGLRSRRRRLGLMSEWVVYELRLEHKCEMTVRALIDLGCLAVDERVLQQMVGTRERLVTHGTHQSGHERTRAAARRHGKLVFEQQMRLQFGRRVEFARAYFAQVVPASQRLVWCYSRHNRAWLRLKVGCGGAGGSGGSGATTGCGWLLFNVLGIISAGCGGRSIESCFYNIEN